MRITRGPLADREYHTVLAEYSRLTQAKIPMNEFRRWVHNAPAGPAWHALLAADDGRVVGHTSVLPILAKFRDNSMLTGMSEYSFVHEDFRKLKIRGYEGSGRPAFITLLNELFQHCIKEGWGPIFASTNEMNQVFTRRVGLRPAEFPLTECLLVLRPQAAARYTPNLSNKQRAILCLAGAAQSGIWSVARHFGAKANGVHTVPIGTEMSAPASEQLSFYEEPESIRWRFLPDQYLHYEFEGKPQDYLIAKRGRRDRYLRVCQYRLGSVDSLNSLTRTLLEQARSEQALGIRWAVYDEGSLSQQIVSGLKQLGFLCAPRVRIVMVHKDFPEYLRPDAWRISDTHFCLDP